MVCGVSVVLSSCMIKLERRHQERSTLEGADNAQLFVEVASGVSKGSVSVIHSRQKRHDSGIGSRFVVRAAQGVHGRCSISLCVFVTEDGPAGT